MNGISKLAFFLHSQLVFLVGLTLSFLFVENINVHYYLLLGFFLLVTIFPAFYFYIVLKSTNSERFKVESYKIEEMSFKNHVLSLIGFVAILLGGLSFLMKEKIDFSLLLQIEGFQYVYLTYALLVGLIIYFFLQNKSKDYSLFESFILINLLKFKIITTKGGKEIHLFTRKSVKKGEVIEGLKHLFGGVYFY